MRKQQRLLWMSPAPRSYRASVLFFVFFVTTDDTPARPRVCVCVCVCTRMCVCAALKFVALVWCISRVALTRSHAHIVAFNCTRHIMSVTAPRLESAAQLKPPPTHTSPLPQHNPNQTTRGVSLKKKKKLILTRANSCTHSGFREYTHTHTHTSADLPVTLFLCWKCI